MTGLPERIDMSIWTRELADVLLPALHSRRGWERVGSIYRWSLVAPDLEASCRPEARAEARALRVVEPELEIAVEEARG